MYLKTALFASIVCLQSLFAQSVIDDYFTYLDKYPTTLGPDGSYQHGEIEIIRDRATIEQVAQDTGRKVGLVADDKYWIWLNDVVRFPGGNYGVYSRIIWKCGLDGIAGVGVLPVLADGKIALNRNFRHATRSWEYELPRGGLNKGETPEQAAKRETLEETGLIADHLECLGKINPDSGLTSTCVPIYLAKIEKKGQADQEESEAIASIDSFTLDELKQGFIDGYLTTTIDSEQVQVNLRDPFLSFALFSWSIRQ